MIKKNTMLKMSHYVLQFLLDSAGDTLDFPRYCLSYKPFSIHESGTDGTQVNHTGRNELTTRRIFEITRKFMLHLRTLKTPIALNETNMYLHDENA